MLQDGFFGFGNGGISLDTVNDFDFAGIKKEVEEIRKDFTKANDAGNYLIGHLESSFDLQKSKPIIERIVKNIINRDENLMKVYRKDLSIIPSENVNDVDLLLDKCWVNFQQKYEFQPMHDHTGIFSFIIFYEIPFSFSEESKMSPGNYTFREKLSGMLNFHYVDYAGVISTMAIPADKDWVKRIIVFPARLKHSVYPFYSSDDYRITISGNLSLVHKEK